MSKNMNMDKEMMKNLNEEKNIKMKRKIRNMKNNKKKIK